MDINSQSRNLLYAVVLILTAFAVHANSLVNGFVWDDNDIIVGGTWDSAFSRFNPENNRDIRKIPHFFVAADTAFEESSPYYRPLNRLSYMFDYLLWGLDPRGYHLTSLALHVLAVLLIYALIVERFGDTSLAFFGALLFAVHPAKVETVNFISSRNNILCTVLYAASLIAFLRYARNRRAGLLVAGGLLTAAALLSKEIAITLPVMLYFMLRRERDRERWTSVAVAGLIALCYLGVRKTVLGSVGPDVFAGLGARLVSVPILLSEYVRLMVYPLHLDACYDFTAYRVTDYRFAAGLAALALGVFLYVRRRDDDAMRTGLIWVAVNMLLIINLVPIPSAPIAERYLYLPLAGFCICVASVLARWRVERPQLVWGVVLVVALALAGRTWQRNTVWKDDEALFRSIIASNPSNPYGHYYLGSLLVSRGGRSAEAISEYEQLVRIVPDSAPAYLALGHAYWFAGKNDRVREVWEKAVALDPANPEALHRLASFHRYFGDKARARELYAALLAIQPGDIEARRALEELGEGR